MYQDKTSCCIVAGVAASKQNAYSAKILGFYTEYALKDVFLFALTAVLFYNVVK